MEMRFIMFIFQKKDAFCLPKEITNEYKFQKILYFYRSYIICQVTCLSTHSDCILKIYTSDTFSKKKYFVQTKLDNTNLILPIKHFRLRKKDYIFYLKERTLKDILYTQGMSLSDILSLGIDLIDAICELSEHNFFEADISPNNIYRNDNGHFCLGDLNLQKQKVSGTPPYLCLENKSSNSFIHNKTHAKKTFEKQMIYSIGKLLDTLCRLQKNFYTNDLQTLLKNAAPDNKIPEISSLREFKSLLHSHYLAHINSDKSLLLLHRDNHPLFQLKTLHIPKSVHTKRTIFLFFLVIISCIFFLFTLHNYHSTYLPEKPIITSKVLQTPVVSPRPSPTNKNSNNKTMEINIQKQNIYSLSSVKTSISSAGAITCIYAGDNPCKNLRSISEFTNLQELYMNNNQITSISEIAKCTSLKILVLSYNKISDISTLKKLPLLEYLDISSNPDINKIDILSDLASLKFLNISNTNITKKQYRQLKNKLPDCDIIY